MGQGGMAILPGGSEDFLDQLTAKAGGAFREDMVVVQEKMVRKLIPAIDAGTMVGSLYPGQVVLK